MANVILKAISNSNISYQTEFETYIPIEEWAEMSRADRVSVMSDALWDDIEVSAMDEETGEYLD